MSFQENGVGGEGGSRAREAIEGKPTNHSIQRPKSSRSVIPKLSSDLGLVNGKCGLDTRPVQLSG